MTLQRCVYPRCFDKQGVRVQRAGSEGQPGPRSGCKARKRRHKRPGRTTAYERLLLCEAAQECSWVGSRAVHLGAGKVHPGMLHSNTHTVRGKRHHAAWLP